MWREPLKPSRKPCPRKVDDSRFDVTERSVSVSCGGDGRYHQYESDGFESFLSSAKGRNQGEKGEETHPPDRLFQPTEPTRVERVDTSEDHALERLERLERLLRVRGQVESVAEERCAPSHVVSMRMEEEGGGERGRKGEELDEPSFGSFIPQTTQPTIPFLSRRPAGSGCSAMETSRGERVPRSRMG